MNNGIIIIVEIECMIFFVFIKVQGGNALLRREEGSKTLQIIVLDNYVSPHKKWKELSKEQMAVILRIQSVTS